MHGKDTEHDCRLELLFKKFQEYDIALWKEKCQLGMAEVKWFDHIYSKHDMSADPSKVESIKAWSKPKNKTEVNSFLQAVPEKKIKGSKIYVDVIQPL